RLVQRSGFFLPGARLVYLNTQEGVRSGRLWECEADRLPKQVGGQEHDDTKRSKQGSKGARTARRRGECPEPYARAAAAISESFGARSVGAASICETTKSRLMETLSL